MYTLAPSILSGDFAYLGEDLKTIKSAGCRWVHVDVMDGHFVPNISIGVPVVKSLRKATPGFLDVHLMISQPARYLEAFAKAADGQATKIIIPSEIQSIAGLVKSAAEIVEK